MKRVWAGKNRRGVSFTITPIEIITNNAKEIFFAAHGAEVERLEALSCPRPQKAEDRDSTDRFYDWHAPRSARRSIPEMIDRR